MRGGGGGEVGLACVACYCECERLPSDDGASIYRRRVTTLLGFVRGNGRADLFRADGEAQLRRACSLVHAVAQQLPKLDHVCGSCDRQQEEDSRTEWRQQRTDDIDISQGKRFFRLL